MGLKSGWIKFCAGVDKVVSGYAYNPAGITLGAWLVGGIMGSAVSLGVLIYDSEASQDFSDSVDQDMKVFEDGRLMRFPDVCGLDDNYYLISQKRGGGMEVSKGNYDYSRILKADTHKDVAKEISACMDDMYSWTRKGNFEFMDEFHYVANVEYSEAGIVDDITEDGMGLYKDISSVSEDDRKSMANKVKADDDYVEEGDNTSLYQAAFNEALQSWNFYRRNANQMEVYYKGDEIKNPDQYAKYEYSSVSTSDWLKTMGGIGLLSLFMLAGSDGARRSSDYHDRKAKRRERLNAIEALSGRDTPIL